MSLQNPLIDHENEWVALTPNRQKVVASDEDLKKLDKKLKKMGQKDVILTYVPPFNYIAPSGRQ